MSAKLSVTKDELDLLWALVEDRISEAGHDSEDNRGKNRNLLLKIEAAIARAQRGEFPDAK